MKKHHNQESYDDFKAQLKVINKFKGFGGPSTNDSLIALNNLRSDYDVDFDELLQTMHKSNNKIQLVKDLKKKTKKLHE